MPKVPCPKCGRQASPNARGPDYVHCRNCGGLVALDQEETTDYGNDPERNAMAREAGWHEVGVIRTPAPARGGLGR